VAISASAQPEDEEQCVVDPTHLVNSEVPDLLAECVRIDGSDHLAQHSGGLFAHHNLRMKAGGGRGL